LKSRIAPIFVPNKFILTHNAWNVWWQLPLLIIITYCVLLCFSFTKP
jgi:hypothetical protein